MRTYEITERAANLGGGRNAKVYEGGEEVAGGAFPICPELPTEEEAYQEALEWAEEQLN
jgi:hypothetical protein